MYFVLCSRVVKMNTGTNEKFAPRTTNSHSNTVSGPFVNRRTAELGATSALATHTCLSAQVLNGEEFVKLFEEWERQTSYYYFCNQFRSLYKRLKAEAEVVHA